MQHMQEFNKTLKCEIHHEKSTQKVGHTMFGIIKKTMLDINFAND